MSESRSQHRLSNASTELSSSDGTAVRDPSGGIDNEGKAPVSKEFTAGQVDSNEPVYTNDDNDDEEGNSVEVEDAGDGTTAADQVLHGIPLLLCGLALLLSMFLVALDQTIIATLLETVGAEFNDFGKISWVSSGYLLPTAVLAMNWGKISLIFGRKYTMLVAIVLFEAGSLVCALANSMNMLIGGRVLAGVGGGGIQVLVFVIVTEITTLEKRGMFQGFIGAAFGIASVVGPLVGGAFTEHVTWRWCFYINLPIGGCAFAGIFFLFHPPLPKGSLKEKIAMIDFIGTALLCSGLVLILLAMTFGSTTKPWNSALVISFFVVGGVLLGLFFAWNFTLSKSPLIPWFVVRVWRVDVVCVAAAAMFGAFMCSVLYLATFFQVVMDANAMHSGIDLLPLIIPVVLCSISSGIFISKTGITKPVSAVGAVLGCIGYGVLTLLNEHSDSGRRIGFLILPGVAIGLSMQSMILNLQTAAPKHNGGVLVATSLMAFCRSLGGAVCSTLGQTIQSVVFREQLVKHNFPNNDQLTTLINSPQAIRQLPKEEQTVVIESFVVGFRAVIYFAMGLFISYALLVGFFTNKKIPKSNTAPGPKPDIEQPAEPESEPEKAATLSGSSQDTTPQEA